MGGGVENVLAVWTEFEPLLERLFGKKIDVARGDWRPGDQRVFYADYRKAQRELGWKPQINLEEGIEHLFNWVKENKELF
jgi:CDP-paratose 2-epimerase